MNQLSKRDIAALAYARRQAEKAEALYMETLELLGIEESRERYGSLVNFFREPVALLQHSLRSLDHAKTPQTQCHREFLRYRGRIHEILADLERFQKHYPEAYRHTQAALRSQSTDIYAQIRGHLIATECLRHFRRLLVLSTRPERERHVTLALRQSLDTNHEELATYLSYIYALPPLHEERNHVLQIAGQLGDSPQVRLVREYMMSGSIDYREA